MEHIDSGKWRDNIFSLYFIFLHAEIVKLILSPSTQALMAAGG